MHSNESEAGGAVLLLAILRHCRGLAFESAGNPYAANHDSNTSFNFTADGVGSLFVAAGLSQPFGTALIAHAISTPQTH
jgi:hypothetical protein